MTEPAQVSIVVLTYERVHELARTLERLAALPERPPLIVVDNGSRDGTAEFVRSRYPQVLLVQHQENIGAAARNLGVARVKTPFVAFCDDDTWWAPGALSRAAAVLSANPKIAAVAAKVLVGVEQTVDETCLRMAEGTLGRDGLPGPRLIAFMGGAVVMRVEAFRQAGGYEPRLFIGAEEALLALDFAARGWSMVYLDDVILHHHPSASRDETQRRLVLLRNRIWIAWLRLPRSDAVDQTRLIAREARQRGQPRWPLARAVLAGMPWVLRARHVLPPDALQLWRRVFRPSHATPG